MTARSSGIFPREGFNLDNETQITASSEAAAVELKNAKTIRVIVMGTITGDGTVAVTLGGETVTFGSDDLDISGVAIAHVRGALCDADNNVQYVATPGTGAATVTACHYELVDGPRRG